VLNSLLVRILQQLLRTVYGSARCPYEPGSLDASSFAVPFAGNQPTDSVTPPIENSSTRAVLGLQGTRCPGFRADPRILFIGLVLFVFFKSSRDPLPAMMCIAQTHCSGGRYSRPRVRSEGARTSPVGPRETSLRPAMMAHRWRRCNPGSDSDRSAIRVSRIPRS